MDDCVFKDVLSTCNQDTLVSVDITDLRLETIIKSSKTRCDNLHLSLNRKRQYKAHANCNRTYCSKEHIKRVVSKKRKSQDKLSGKDTKVLRSASKSRFDVTRDCFFCGLFCQLEPDPKNPSRWRIAHKCTTADRGNELHPDNLSFKDVVLQVCDLRGDEKADQVRVRLGEVVADLHAAGACWHEDCRDEFMPKRNIQAAKNKTNTKKTDPDPALTRLLAYMTSNNVNTWSSKGIHKVYCDDGGHLSVRFLMKKVKEWFGSDLLILKSNGLCDILMFKAHASTFLHLEEDDDDSVDVSKLAKKISKEIKDMKSENVSYHKNMDIHIASKQISPTLAHLLSEISNSLDSSLSSLLIGNIVSSCVNKGPTPLQVALSVLLGERNLIEHLYEYGITCSYSEFLRYRTSAAVDQDDKGCLDVLPHNGGLVQVIADNFDLLISTFNGLKQCHELAMILIQYGTKEGTSDTTFRRLSKQELTDVLLKSVPTVWYKGPKQPQMPEDDVLYCVPPLKLLAQQKVSLVQSQNTDFKFFHDMATQENTPEFSGYNEKQARDSGKTKAPGTSVMYSPMINRKPADPTTMLSSMVEGQRQTAIMGQEITVFTADQQLYKIMIDVTWVYHSLFTNFVPRLGGMHFLTSFIGSIGTLNANSGVEEILQKRFAGVHKMLEGKKFPSNIRALRLLVEEILKPHISEHIGYK